MPWFLRLKSEFILILLPLLIGCVAPHGRALPPEKTNLAQTATRATCDYSERLATVFDKVAQQLETGEISSATQANQALAKGNRLAREEAFAPVNEAVHQQIGDDLWNATTAAQLFHQIAQGHRKVQP